MPWEEWCASEVCLKCSPLRLRSGSIPDQQTKQVYFYYGSDLVFHVPARAAGKGDGGDGEEIAIYVKGCQEAGRGTAREGRCPRDTSSVILLSNCLCCVLERERARQSKDSLSANKELNGSTLCKNRCRNQNKRHDSAG